MPHETAAISVRSVYTIQPCYLMQSHICKVYACLAVTCHLHFWQNDRDLLRATAVTRGWNGYWNKSQYRKLTLEKKILPSLLQGFEPATFRSRVQRSNHWAIPAHPWGNWGRGSCWKNSGRPPLECWKARNSGMPDYPGYWYDSDQATFSSTLDRSGGSPPPATST